MKHVGSEIHRIVESKKMVKKEVAARLGISGSQFGQMRNSANVDLDKLEKLCNILDISPLYFFDGWKGENGGVTVGDIKNSTVVGDATVAVASRNEASEVQVLRELLSEKERMIKVLLKQLGIEDVS